MEPMGTRTTRRAPEELEAEVPRRSCRPVGGGLNARAWESTKGARTHTRTAGDVHLKRRTRAVGAGSWPTGTTSFWHIETALGTWKQRDRNLALDLRHRQVSFAAARQKDFETRCLGQKSWS